MLACGGYRLTQEIALENPTCIERRVIGCEEPWGKLSESGHIGKSSGAVIGVEEGVRTTIFFESDGMALGAPEIQQVKAVTGWNKAGNSFAYHVVRRGTLRASEPYADGLKQQLIEF